MATIRNRKGILYIDFRYQCKRYVLSTGLPGTKQNQQKAKLKANAIEYDISNSKLDLSRYGFICNKKGKQESTLDSWTFDPDLGQYITSIVATPSTDAYSGNYSAKIKKYAG